MSNTFDAGVTVEGLRYTRAKQTVLEHVDLQAPPGEVTAVVGPAGSGRTALMQILGAAARPDGGSVRLAGHDPVTDPVAARALVGVVSEEVSVWEYLSCYEVLHTLARGHRMPRDRRGDRIAEVLRLTGLSQAAGLGADHLDLAGKRHLGLAAALLHDPAILLLDSPTVGLDLRSRQAFLRIVRDQADEGRTVVITGTDAAELADVADFAVPLHHGRTGTAQSLSRTGADAARSRSRSWLARSDNHEQLIASLGRLGLSFTEHGPDSVLIQLADDHDAATLAASLRGLGVPLSCLYPLTSPPASVVGPRTAAEELR